MIRYSPTPELKAAILEILKQWHKTDPGWWYGYDVLIIQLNDEGFKTKEKEVKKALQMLYRERKVCIMPIFSEQTGLLAGCAYFHKEE